jgi:hypothetical protein
VSGRSASSPAASHAVSPLLGSRWSSEDPLGRVRAERAVGPHERVLRDLLGVLAAPGQPMSEREEAILIRRDELLEVPVEVLREPLPKRLVLCHAQCCPTLHLLRLPQHQPETRRTARGPRNLPLARGASTDHHALHLVLKHRRRAFGCTFGAVG